jgi:hypothetical protein
MKPSVMQDESGHRNIPDGSQETQRGAYDCADNDAEVLIRTHVYCTVGGLLITRRDDPYGNAEYHV